MTALVHNRTFRWIAFILTVDTLLEWFGTIALMALVYRHTGSTSVAAGLLICKQIAPAVLVHVAAPHLDRLGLGRGLAAALTLQSLALFAIAACGYGAPLFLLAVITGTAGTLVRSMLRAAISLSLDGDQLRAGNAFVNIAVALTSLVGPVLAALVATTLGTQASLLTAATLTALCVASATQIPSMSAEETVADESDRQARTPVASALPLNWMLALSAVLFCIFAMDEPTLLAYCERSLDAGVGAYGAIFATWGVGLTIGGIAFSRLLKVPMLQLAMGAMTMMAFAYIGLGVAPTIEMACAAAVFGGIGNGMGFVALATAVQEATPRGSESSSAARFQSIATAGPGAGIVIGGVLADLADPRLSLIVPGVLALFVIGAGAVALWAREAALTSSPSALLSSPTSGGSA